MRNCHALNKGNKNRCENHGYLNNHTHEGHEQCHHLFCKTHDKDNVMIDTHTCFKGEQLPLMDVPTSPNPKMVEFIHSLRERFTMEGDIIVAGSGSRSIAKASPEVQAKASEKLNATLDILKEMFGDRLVILSGMAEGWDKGIAINAIKKDIRLWCAVPNRGYGNYYWSAAHSISGQDRRPMFREILDKAEKVVHIMEDVHNTNDLYIKGRHANFLRNDWMVENADMFLIWDPSSPGTADCFTSVKRARKAYIVMSQGIL